MYFFPCFNGRATTCWHKRSLCFHLAALFFSSVYIGHSSSAGCFSHGAVHFESVHSRKCKPQVLCVSLFLFPKVCCDVLTMQVLFFPVLWKRPPKQTWECCGGEQNTSTNRLSYWVWKNRNTFPHLSSVLFSGIFGETLIHGNYFDILTWFLN